MENRESGPPHLLLEFLRMTATRRATTENAVFWEVMDSANVALVSVVGSHAYGTARPGSDVDLRGFFVAPTADYWKVGPNSQPPDTIDRREPDLTFYEVEKFMRLAGAANPNVLEVLWCEALRKNEIGDLLIENRDAFLSRQVRTTYGGYALSQLHHAKKGTGGSRGREHFKREKFMLHLFRLLEQGTLLLSDPDNFTTKVSDPEKLWEMAAWPLERVEVEFERRRDEMDAAARVSSLPDRPNWERLSGLLACIRRDNLLR